MSGSCGHNIEVVIFSFSIMVLRNFFKVEAVESVVQLSGRHGGSAFERLSPPLGLSSDNESAFAFGNSGRGPRGFGRLQRGQLPGGPRLPVLLRRPGQKMYIFFPPKSKRWASR